jgi:hypothetical protein
MFTDKGGNVQRRRCEANRGNHDSSLSGFVNVPNVQETLVGSGSDVEFGAAGCTIQGGPDVFLGISEFRERHSKGRTVLQLSQVSQNHGNHLLVLAGPGMWNVTQIESFKVCGNPARIHRIPPAFRAYNKRNIEVS